MKRVCFKLSDPDNIAANLRGEISSQQRAAFDSAVRSRGGVALLVLGLGFSLVGFIIYAMFTARPPPTVGRLAHLVLALIGIPGVVAIGQSFRSLVRLALAWRELSAGQIRQDLGQVSWLGDDYVAQIPGRRLRSGGDLNLLPGSYRFFYLPRAGWLLSAEWLNTTGEEWTRRELLNILAQANNFSLDGLAANREGRLSSDQRARATRELVLFGVVALLSFLVDISFHIWLGFKAERNPPGVVRGLTFLAILVLILTIAVIVWKKYKFIVDLRVGQVAMIEGVVRKSIVATGSSREVYYYYRVGGLKFMVPERGYAALIEGLSYRLYYTPRAKVLVGIEPMGIHVTR